LAEDLSLEEYAKIVHTYALKKTHSSCNETFEDIGGDQKHDITVVLMAVSQ